MGSVSFSEWFQDALGRPFPLPAALQPIRHLGETVWGSENLSSKMLVPPMTPEFMAGLDYTLAGHWGHGANSYAIYYIGVWGTHRVFFRLAFGGVYSDPDRDAAFAIDYLSAYLRFRERWLSQLERSTVVHNMGTSFAEITRMGRVTTLSDEPGGGTAEGTFFARLERLLSAE